MTRVVDGYRNITDEQVRAGTGRDWSEWVVLLDACDGENKNFSAVSKYLIKRYGVSKFWAQVVAVYYKWEHILGR